jgi:hypothetical protein
MACPRCLSFFARSREDRGVCDRAGVYRDLGATFEVLECHEDKYDSGTMWWYGKARCRTCGQHARFEYMCGGQNYAEVTPKDTSDSLGFMVRYLATKQRP